MSQCSPASPQLPATETRLSPLQPQPQPPHLHHSPAAHLHPTELLHSPEPTELLDDIAQLHSDSTELHRGPEHTALRGSPAAPLAEDMEAPQGLSSPHSEPAKLQTTAVSPHANPETKPASTGHQGDLVGTNSSASEQPEGPTLAHDHGPAEMHESSAPLSPSSSSAISKAAEDQLIATTPPPSPVHCSSTSCSDAHSPPSPVQLQPGSTSQQTPPADTPSQSLVLHSPAQVCTSQLPQRPTDDRGPPLDQETSATSSQVLPRCGDGRSGFTLHPHCPPLHGGSGTGVQQDSPKPLSAPCSPSPSQPPPKSSVSLPASPVRSQVQLASPQLAVQSGVILQCTSKPSPEELHCTSTQTGLADQRPPVEDRLASLSPASNLCTDDTDEKPSAGSAGPSPGQFSVAAAPPRPTPESLVPSENSSLSCCPPAGEEMLPPPPHSPSGSFPQRTESTDIVQKSSASSSPAHTSQMPTLSAASGPAGVLSAGPSPASDRSPGRPSSLLESPVRSPGRPVGSQAATPRPTDLNPPQSDESVAARHPHPSAEPELRQLNSSPDRLDQVSVASAAASISDAPGEPVHDQEKVVCASAEDAQTNGGPPSSAHPSHAPGWRPPPCHHPQSPAGQASPLHVENTSRGSPSSTPTTQSSLAQTTADFQSSHSLAQSSEICCGPHQSPVPHTETSPGPSSSLNADAGASLLMLNPSLPDRVHSESAPQKPDSVGGVLAEPGSSSLCNQPAPESAAHALQPGVAEGQPSTGSSAPPSLSSAEAAPSPRTPLCSSPTQVNGSMPSCSNIPEASACAQARSPHTGTSSPADSEKCGQLQTADTQVHPSPGSSPSDQPPSTGPDGPEPRCLATLTQSVEAQSESAAAEGEFHAGGAHL